MTLDIERPAAVTIYGREHRPEVGSYILLDGLRIGDKLLAGDPPVDSGYRGCQFRMPSRHGGSVACDVEVTGRTLQRHNGSLFVRVRITWVGDCEPDKFSSGWMLAE